LVKIKDEAMTILLPITMILALVLAGYLSYRRYCKRLEDYSEELDRRLANKIAYRERIKGHEQGTS
jgi:hypothetical protein